MKAYAAARTAPYARSVVRPSCPHCKDVLFAATVSVHVHDNDIRHWWSCETCGHQFMTTVSPARDHERQLERQLS
jgi:hypothetical protein